jgi:hypothetical protein
MRTHFSHDPHFCTNGRTFAEDVVGIQQIDYLVADTASVHQIDYLVVGIHVVIHPGYLDLDQV